MIAEALLSLTRTAHRERLAFRFVAVCCLLSTGAVAHARSQVHPYLEIGQVVTADLEPQGPALTYSQATMGVDVTQRGVRSEAQLSYRYERIIGWGAAKGQQSRHIGFARASANAVPNLLDVEVGALATQVRNSLDGPSPSLLPVDRQQLTQLYSTYAGAQLRPSLGPLSARARYYVGYTRADVRQSGAATSDVRFGSALAQDALASVGMAPGILPFGWSLSGSWAREDQSSLSQYITSRTLRGEIVLPLLPNLAVTAGVDHGWNRVGQKSVGGANPVPPKLLYVWDGRGWDAGVYWRPSARTSVQARYGRRHGSDLVLIDATWEASQHSYVSAQVYDQEQSFGLLVTRQMAGLPRGFEFDATAFQDAASACAFGREQAGGCLNAVVSSPRLGIFRARGGDVTWSIRGRYWDIGLGVGALERTFLMKAAAEPAFRDIAYYGQLNIGYQLSRRTNFSSNVAVSLFDDDQGGEAQSLRTSLSLAHYISRRWSARGAIGLVQTWSQARDRLSAWGQASLRYAF